MSKTFVHASRRAAGFLPYVCRMAVIVAVFAAIATAASADGLEPIKYRNPGLIVDLKVGLWAWPLPMDYDHDGDPDLVVSCPDKPYNGTYFFENMGDGKLPVFKPAVRIGDAPRNVQASYVDGQVRLLAPGMELVSDGSNLFASTHKIYKSANVHPTGGRVRANQWKYADYDGDGRLDLIVGVGDWEEYGWDDAFDPTGHWTRGPLHGYVYLVRNHGTNEMPQYDDPAKLMAAGQAVDVYGMPSPNLADFDGDGDLDLLCGEFLDHFNYYENIGSRTKPEFAAARQLAHDGEPIAMDLEMITPVAFDWDGDGDMDLIVGDEDGRVALVEHTGSVEHGTPEFLPPRYFQQQADEVKFGALVTPVSTDLDGDGDEDLVCGNSAGYIAWIENLDGGNPPRWDAPRYFKSDGETLRVQAGENGSIQGPCEAKWGYTTLSVADWDHDALPDLVVNSIWGRVVWYRNIGTRAEPEFAASQPVEVEWKSAPPNPAWNWWEPRGKELATQWRTTPLATDFDGDGLNDLVMLDHEGYLAFFQRRRIDGQLRLMPPKRIFRGEGSSVFGPKHEVQSKENGLLRLNAGTAGKSGRRKLCLADYDGDGRVDLLVNSLNINFLRNVGSDGAATLFHDMGPVDDRLLAGHTTSPTVVDWDRDGRLDLLVGAEDGRLYYLRNPYVAEAATPVR